MIDVNRYSYTFRSHRKAAEAGSRHSRLRRVLCTAVLFVWAATACFAEDLAVKASVDRTVVGMNEQFTLVVELSGSDLNASSKPQLPEMERFAAFLGSGSSQNMQYINGRMSVSKTISYHFQAIQEGEFQIGSVLVEAKGKTYRTEPIQLRIQKAATRAGPSTQRESRDAGSTISEEDLFLKVQVNKNRVFQNEPVIMTYKIYTRVNVGSFGFANVPGTAGFWVEEFDTGRQPVTSKEVLGGKQYTVATIRKIALFPMSPGEKIIDPLAVECEVRVQRNSRSMLDDFFNDPFFGRSVRKVVKSEPVRITVSPFPAEGKPSDFEGIVGQYTMNGSVDKTIVKTNEAVTFNISVTGQGNIRTLPEIKPRFPTDFEVYPPKINETMERKGRSITGGKTYEWVLVPRRPGLLKIKPVRLVYFDPSGPGYRVLRTDEFTVDVAQGEDLFVSAPSGLSKTEVALLGQDIRFILTEFSPFVRVGRKIAHHPGFWTMLFIPLISLATAILYRRHTDRLQGDEAYARKKRASRSARKHISVARALVNSDSTASFYTEVGKALNGFLGDKLNIAEAGLMMDEVETKLKKRSVKNETIEEIMDCIRICDLKRFSPTGTTSSEMEAFVHRVEKTIDLLDRDLVA